MARITVGMGQKAQGPSAYHTRVPGWGLLQQSQVRLHDPPWGSGGAAGGQGPVVCWTDCGRLVRTPGL